MLESISNCIRMIISDLAKRQPSLENISTKPYMTGIYNYKQRPPETKKPEKPAKPGQRPTSPEKSLSEIEELIKKHIPKTLTQRRPNEDVGEGKENVDLINKKNELLQKKFNIEKDVIKKELKMDDAVNKGEPYDLTILREIDKEKRRKIPIERDLKDLERKVVQAFLNEKRVSR